MDQEALKTRIDEILFYKWDPIGLSDSTAPRDEYSQYVDGVLELAQECDAWEPLMAHLTDLAARQMCCLTNQKNDARVAMLILSLVRGEDDFPDQECIDVD